MAYVKCIRNLISSTVPDGKTVTPTDDISIWLACGGRSETYTTLSQVLADSTCLSALINSNNAVDYLVRSTTWASDVCGDSGAMTAIGGNNYASNTLTTNITWLNAIASSSYIESVMNVKTPSMTSNFEPSGVCNGSSTIPTTGYFYAFDNDSSTAWLPESTDNTPWISYQFTAQQIIKSVRLLFKNVGTSNTANAYIEGSNDNGSTWNLIHTEQITLRSVAQSFGFLNSTPYDTFRIRFDVPLYVSGSYNAYVEQVQFYGRADV